MESKIVKFEIGKLLAVVITVAVVAVAATFFISSNYFKGCSVPGGCDLYQAETYTGR